MKAVILAGGYGSRLSEETQIRPKPMVEIGGMPILWHIMRIYTAAGINEFIICCGYKGHMIKQFFADYFLYRCDVSFDLKDNRMEVLHDDVEHWKVTLVDTGEATMTGGRLRRVRNYIGDQTFCFTYGDGVTNLDIRELIDFHKEQKTLATLTAVQPPGRFGALSLGRAETKISTFHEKPSGDGGWINGGYFVLEPGVMDYIADDSTVWEREPLEALAQQGQLSAYKFRGFWQNMDTLRDRMYLEQLWASGNPPWRTWRD